MKSGHQLEFDELYFYNTLKTGITLPVLLRLDALKTSVEAKLDTGASHCIFQRFHGEYLGLEIEKGELLSFETVTGSFRAFGHEVSMKVLETEFLSTVYFAENENFAKNVLGRQGWLDRVKLGLIDYEGKLFLGEYNK
jgi:hypothetical protein